MNRCYLLSTIIVLLTFNSYGQSGLLGTWYLDFIVKDGITHPNYFNDSTVFSIEFTSNSGDLPNTQFFSSGHGCNASNGSFSVNSNELWLAISGTTLADCLTAPYAQYEAVFYDILIYDDVDSIHNIEITGTGDNEQLILTNPIDGNTLVFGKNPPTILLISTWWLYQIDIPGNPIIDIPETDGPFISFTNNVDFSMPVLPELNGIGECEGLSGFYNITFNGANNLNIVDFVQTLSACATGSYEGIYFGILGTEPTNLFEFEISEDGSTLILTDVLGARLIFGNAPLSVFDSNLENRIISIAKNPSNDILELIISDNLNLNEIHYEIFDVTGKQISIGNLNQKRIDVSRINSGLYFIRFQLINSEISTQRFIKK